MMMMIIKIIIIFIIIIIISIIIIMMMMIIITIIIIVIINNTVIFFNLIKKSINIYYYFLDWFCFKYLSVYIPLCKFLSHLGYQFTIILLPLLHGLWVSMWFSFIVIVLIYYITVKKVCKYECILNEY